MSDARFTATNAVFADPTCRAILTRLANRETSVTELAKPFEMSLPANSKNLKFRERAGLVQRHHDSRRRPCQLQTQPFSSFADCGEQSCRVWDERRDRLAHDLQARQVDSMKCVEIAAKE